MKLFGLTLIASALTLGSGIGAHAGLNAVDPGPYTAATGFFPHWYQDTQAVALDLCLSKAVSSRVPGAPGAPSYMCTLLPNPGIFNDALPIVWPTNFPDEGFYFTGDAAIDATTVPNPQGINLIYVSAVEAAFGGGVPAPGDQITFARIRIRVDTPVAGDYIITHPYGVLIKNNVPAGVKAINDTVDIGIGAPGDFTGALAGDIGPFLRSANVNAPYTEINPDTGLPETFIGDPNLLEQATGSPFGTNYVRVQGPNGIDVRTDLFAISGKLFEATVPTPLNVERASYSHGPLGIFEIFQTDVFALAPSTATLEFTDAGANTTAMQDADGNGEFYGYDNLNLPAALSTLDVTAINPPGNLDTTKTGTLVDLVTISSATYSLGSGVLTVVAASSDEISTPQLTLEGTGLTGSGAAGVTFTTDPGSPLTIPPATVTVTSANGGSDTETVVLVP